MKHEEKMTTWCFFAPGSLQNGKSWGKMENHLSDTCCFFLFLHVLQCNVNLVFAMNKYCGKDRWRWILKTFAGKMWFIQGKKTYAQLLTKSRATLFYVESITGAFHVGIRDPRPSESVDGRGYEFQEVTGRNSRRFLDEQNGIGPKERIGLVSSGSVSNCHFSIGATSETSRGFREVVETFLTVPMFLQDVADFIKIIKIHVKES